MSERLRSANLMVMQVLSDPSKVDALRQNPEKLKEFAVEATRMLDKPTPPANDWLWLIIVGAFAITMLFSAAVLGFTVTAKIETGVSYVTKSETIVTLFSTVVAFLAGLLSPSPVRKGE